MSESIDHLHRTQPNAIAVLNELRDDIEPLETMYADMMCDDPKADMAHKAIGVVLRLIHQHQVTLTKEVEAVESEFEAKRPAPEQREPELEARCRDES